MRRGSRTCVYCEFLSRIIRQDASRRRHERVHHLASGVRIGLPIVLTLGATDGDDRHCDGLRAGAAAGIVNAVVQPDPSQGGIQGFNSETSTICTIRTSGLIVSANCMVFRPILSSTGDFRKIWRFLRFST